MYERFAEWLDISLNTDIPDEVVAFCFNLCEVDYNTWAVELIGSPYFDENDSDWACHEVYNNREYSYKWKEEAEWEDIHNKVETFIRQYLFIGKYADFFKKYQAVAMGFTDGDLTIVYQAEEEDIIKNCPECGKEMQTGVVKAQVIAGLFHNVTVSWCPNEDKDKWIQNDAVNLKLKGKGYYCSECMKVFTILEEK